MGVVFAVGVGGGLGALARYYIAGSVVLSILALFAGLWVVRAIYA